MMRDNLLHKKAPSTKSWCSAFLFCFVYRLMHKKALHLFWTKPVSPIFSFSTDFWKDRFEIKEKMELEWKSGIFAFLVSSSWKRFKNLVSFDFSDSSDEVVGLDRRLDVAADKRDHVVQKIRPDLRHSHGEWIWPIFGATNKALRQTTQKTHP